MDKFNNIKTLHDLSYFLKIPIRKITYILYKKGIDNLYTSFEIPKKNGGVRHINAPLEDLKDIQRKLVLSLWAHQKHIWEESGKTLDVSHAFQKEKSIITNAQIHRNKRFVLNIDLENFFESFHFGRVRGFFEKDKNFLLPKKVATIIAQLTCYEGHLPQGAPSSPIITNLICNILDMKLLKLSKKYKLNYTRYADDLTFSTNNKHFLDQQSDFYEELSKIIERAGFKINEKKTRLQFRNSKQEVTGLVVNKKVNVDRNYYKITRSMAHSLYTKGNFHIDRELGEINQLEGRFSFINQLDRYNNLVKKDRDKNVKLNFRNLNSREKQYQMFLFYKYFYRNKRPLIVTEGKTDIEYLKSALKNLYKDYPNLITKKSDETFEFKVSFLRRTKRLSYFLDIKPDGADTMKNIYNYYVGKENNGYPNFVKKFKDLGSIPNHPVIFILDNELNNSSKPLKKIMNHMGLNKDVSKSSFCSEDYYMHITENLYLLTHQLVKGLPECEIEDLFDDSILNQKIHGKSFERDDKKFNINNHYGKANFADYISKNYRSVNFSEFKYMLDHLNSIVTFKSN
ncbi:retron Ec67 family RNA-directed DNA polymerase/endonuclease [Bacillus cereus]|uniref:retron Ec67 family RNA-directed DNA polymerase/endonuclease n=1 Tax=Bacillus cereus TaxID=1396 RepID=UPI00387EFD9C